jgi:putative ABC transport system permease protein
VHISEAVAQLYGLKPGDSWPLLSKAFSLQTQDHQAPAASFYIASVWRDYVRQFGAVALDWKDYLALVGHAGNAAQISEIAVWPESQSQLSGTDLQAAIEQALGTPGQPPPALEFVSSQALRERSCAFSIAALPSPTGCRPWP